MTEFFEQGLNKSGGGNVAPATEVTTESTKGGGNMKQYLIRYYDGESLTVKEVKICARCRELAKRELDKIAPGHGCIVQVKPL